MFSFSPFISFHTEMLASVQQARIEMMRALFPQILPWRMARIQGALTELARLPAVFSRTFSDSLADAVAPGDAISAEAEPAARKPAARRKTKAKQPVAP